MTRDEILEMRAAGLTMREIATKCGVSVTTLYNRVGNYDFKHRQQTLGTCVAEGCNRPRAVRKDDARFCWFHQPDRICRKSGCTFQKQTGGLCHSHYKEIHTKILDLHGGDLEEVAVRYSLEWTNRTLNRQGYVTAWYFGSKVLEHRVVMGRQVGRKLLPTENVHHLNGNRSDNRIDNLELWVTSQPWGQRASDLVRYAHEIIERYAEPEDLVAFAYEILKTYGDAA